MLKRQIFCRISLERTAACCFRPGDTVRKFTETAERSLLNGHSYSIKTGDRFSREFEMRQDQLLRDNQTVILESIFDLNFLPGSSRKETGIPAANAAAFLNECSLFCGNIRFFLTIRLLSLFPLEIHSGTTVKDLREQLLLPSPGNTDDAVLICSQEKQWRRATDDSMIPDRTNMVLFSI